MLSQPTVPEIDRFLSNTHGLSVTRENAHWLFVGPQYDRNTTRAPRVYFGGIVQTAAVVMYTLDGTIIATGDKLHRLCGERTCVRPSHHRLGAKPRVAKPSREDVFNSRWIEVDRGFPEPCRIWTGTRKLGYGLFRRDFAHRVAWKMAHPDEPLPKKSSDYRIGHTCHVLGSTESKACVQPAHLKKMTVSEALHLSPNHIINRPEVVRGGRKDPALCRKGLHAWVGENIYEIAPGKNTCRECYRIRYRARDARRAQMRRDANALFDRIREKREREGDTMLRAAY